MLDGQARVVDEGYRKVVQALGLVSMVEISSGLILRDEIRGSAAILDCR